jgi:hypothetical protein
MSEPSIFIALPREALPPPVRKFACRHSVLLIDQYKNQDGHGPFHSVYIGLATGVYEQSDW